jgi:hypothetical protein
MKVAILISGLPRRTFQNAPHFRKFIKSTHEVYVFSHYWYEKDRRNLNSPNSKRFREKAPRFVKYMVKFGYKCSMQESEIPENWDLGPKLVISQASVDEFFPWGRDYSEGSVKFRSHLLSNNISMWNSIKKSLDLALRYATKEEIVFDYIVRMRFDVIPTVTLDEILEKVNEKNILVPDTNHPKNMINDWFAIGRPELMGVYMNLFEDIESIFDTVQSKHGVWCNELGLYEHLKRHQIETFNSDVKMLFH